jgi:hypothetical protein
MGKIEVIRVFRSISRVLKKCLERVRHSELVSESAYIQTLKQVQGDVIEIFQHPVSREKHPSTGVFLSPIKKTGAEYSRPRFSSLIS